jgi:hypothetical protein
MPVRLRQELRDLPRLMKVSRSPDRAPWHPQPHCCFSIRLWRRWHLSCRRILIVVDEIGLVVVLARCKPEVPSGRAVAGAQRRDPVSAPSGLIRRRVTNTVALVVQVIGNQVPLTDRWESYHASQSNLAGPSCRLAPMERAIKIVDPLTERYKVTVTLVTDDTTPAVWRATVRSGSGPGAIAVYSYGTSEGDAVCNAYSLMQRTSPAPL